MILHLNYLSIKLYLYYAIYRIDTVRQFIEANLSWGRKGAIPPFDAYFDLSVGKMYIYTKKNEFYYCKIFLSLSSLLLHIILYCVKIY